MLTSEFFKFLGNLSKANHAKMRKHILNQSGPSCKFKHPKVVVKQPTTVVEDCYLVKKWIERRKRKGTACLQLDLIRPMLGLFTNGNKQSWSWRGKNSRKITTLARSPNMSFSIGV